MSDTPLLPTRVELARELLRYKMEDYSQNGFCASWLIDLEWDLWTASEKSDPDPAERMTVEFSRECRVLGEIANGWWVWEDKTRPAEVGPVFITMERWLEKLAEPRRSFLRD
jgi:hypothetical protein